MSERILTGITTSGIPHLGNYFGAIRPSLDLANSANESFFFLADYHSIIKVNKPKEVAISAQKIAMAWLACGLDPNKTFFYRQSDIKQILELSWILHCVTSKGLMNRAHAYKALKSETDDKGINMGLFSYPILMAADILIFNATKVPVGPDQTQHLEMTRDIANKFNHTFGEVFTIPEALIDGDGESLPGTDGKKMSKSYQNIIPLLSTREELKKSILKIVTNSLEPGEPKDYSTCNVFKIYSYFADNNEIDEFKAAYEEGISWGDAKNKLFELADKHLEPIRDKYFKLESNPQDVIDLLDEGGKKVMPMAEDLLCNVRESIGIT